MDKAEKQADQFDKIYQEAKTYLDKEVNKIFDKFQRDYGLSQVEARQVLKNMEDKKNLNELRKVLEARPNDPNIQRLLADLDSPAYSFRMKRLERFSDDLDRMRESIYHSEKTGSDAFYSDLMKDSYYKATFDLQQQTGLAYGFSGLPESEIKQLQSFSWVGDGSTYSTDIWKNTGKLTSSIKDELLMSLMTGRDTRETAQAIAERFNVGQNDARRLVRTESAFFHNQMELLSYEAADIEKYIFVAVLDKRTSRICQEHDNQVYDRDKAVPGVNCPPMHPWCRSTTVAYDEDADYSKLKRRARNPETGKTELVPADMTYKEWYSKYVDGNIESIKHDEGTPKTTSDILFEERLPKAAEEKVLSHFDFFNNSRIVLRPERLEHILEGHSDIGDDVEGIVHGVIKKPDMILIDHKNDNSILVLGKSLENSVNVVVRLSNTDFDNSIITAMRVSDKTLKRLLKKNKKIYDKNE
ncbi:phage putative head morphogenesis protein%2C SPP1 gp7 family [Streptococcus pneumoniae]|uniref:Phage putative head morphogenesis protein, SPP1 gp7 family n=1 Tax=Streptococcus pneumoniae TaxID=1313 RepID=A0AA86XQB3_STREE|nr:phage putative head morphogenesis protein%2C SPP1 gp7 family [Streptococcus pneumoniae]CIS17530.1 phage putative head morphogenesis protein%2C SPP1 gp7 family [Streptococcus pneumoniae]CIY91470.1 phage putative head morphogenesis protein%2C SPP1 gp7 family [Streptococcus pneumoniae]CJV04638.1 phage putative head morphogenesis protein%2C SPP1 gp7 family [Streptococcus pneumoniae]CJW64768.1 phage putative head morphogenesis protein%2C SPP1 gp7 family [Streptococcus pneumoniae]